MRKPAAPSSVQQFIAHPPSWIVIRSATTVDATIHLGAGENEAISLAMELHADRILMDDRAAHHAATQRGIRAIGTLTVLFDAAGRGLLRLPDALKRLQATNFRAPASIIQQLLALDAKRAPAPPQNPS